MVTGFVFKLLPWSCCFQLFELGICSLIPPVRAVWPLETGHQDPLELEQAGRVTSHGTSHKGRRRQSQTGPSLWKSRQCPSTDVSSSAPEAGRARALSNHRAGPSLGTPLDLSSAAVLALTCGPVCWISSYLSRNMTCSRCFFAGTGPSSTAPGFAHFLSKPQ